MGVISIVGKVVLVLVNIIILLISLLFIGLGAAIVAGKDFYNGLLDNMEDQLKEAFTSLGVTVDSSNFSITDFMLPIAYALIAIGIIMGAIAIVGCIGGCYAIKLLLIVYAIVLGVIFAAQVIVVIIVYADKSAFDDTVKPYIKDLLDDFSGIEGTDTKTLAWNALMHYEQCCGVDDYQDFSGLTNWPPATIGGVSVNLVTPVICCKTLSTNYACAESPGATSATNNMFIGCYDKLYDLVIESTVVITALVLFLAFQFAMLFFAIWIICTMDNKIDII